MNNSFYRKIYRYIYFIPLITIPLLITSCGGNRIERRTGDAGTITSQATMQNAPYIKLHMKNGDVYLMQSWKVDDDNISGNGRLYDYDRVLKKAGAFEIPVKDVALAETNSISSASSIAIMVVPTIATGIVGIICLANPKACFGSCPTFYTVSGKDYNLQAEGFSASVSPCLEAKDIDALYNYSAESSDLDILVKNEAYESHYIRHADILAVPRAEGNRVLAAEDGQFYEVNRFTEPSGAWGAEGDCSEKLCSYDGEERFSKADSTDLAAKEIIDLTIGDVTPGKKGIVIASRQSLLMTYIFYQGLAYMGTAAGEYFAKLERDTTLWKGLMQNTRSELGRIEVYIDKNDGQWEKIGETGEYGPIASDIKIIPFDFNGQNSPLHVKLKMTRGFWRIDYVSLADIAGKVTPVRIAPSESFPEKDSRGSDVVTILNNSDSLLVTMPGDEYTIHYNLPGNPNNYELFLESRGYYMEWMREEWMAEEDPEMVFSMFLNPKQYFKDLAPRYKEIEAGMEETFWSSKYVNP